MFSAKHCCVPPLSACCVYQCLRRGRGYCTVSLLAFSCVRTVHCTVTLLPWCFIPGRPRKPGGGHQRETGEQASDISVMDAVNTTQPHEALILAEPPTPKDPPCDVACALLGLLSSIYQCHSGSHGITGSVSIGVCQLVSLIGIYVCEAYTFRPWPCVSPVSHTSLSRCLGVSVYCQPKPPDSLVWWWNFDYFSRSPLFVPREVCL